MALPPKAFYSLIEAAARWNCSIADLAGWASVGRFDIVAGIGLTQCGEEMLAGFVAIWKRMKSKKAVLDLAARSRGKLCVLADLKSAKLN